MDREYISPVGREGLYILDTGSWRLVRPVLDREVCTGCGLCSAYCPVNSIRQDEAGYRIDLTYCKGCGICAHECPSGAITMQPEGGSRHEPD